MVENAGELWKGAKLDVVLLRELPSVPKLYLPVPVNVDTKDDIGIELGEKAFLILLILSYTCGASQCRH